jgi:hypothetical protein
VDLVPDPLLLRKFGSAYYVIYKNIFINMAFNFHEAQTYSYPFSQKYLRIQ